MMFASFSGFPHDLVCGVFLVSTADHGNTQRSLQRSHLYMVLL